MRLERRLDQLEQYTQIKDVIITSLKTTHCFYSSTVEGVEDVEAQAMELESLEKQVLLVPSKAEHRCAELYHNGASYPPNKNRNRKPAAIVMQFADRKYKTELKKAKLEAKRIWGVSKQSLHQEERGYCQAYTHTKEREEDTRDMDTGLPGDDSAERSITGGGEGHHCMRAHGPGHVQMSNFLLGQFLTTIE